MNPTNPRVLVPPRPNLGPEPWSEVGSSTSLLLEIGILLVVLLAGALWIIHRRRASRRRSVRPRTHPVAPDDSPAAQLLNLASQVRETLVARFGPSLRARTTEEIAADPQLKEALGDKHFEPLIDLLSAADRWKFAPVPHSGREEHLREDLSGWQVWHESFLAERPPKR